MTCGFTLTIPGSSPGCCHGLVALGDPIYCLASLESSRLPSGEVKSAG